MLHQYEFTPPTQTKWSGAKVSNRLDCETGVLLRCALQSEFQHATSWANLRRRLEAKGFDLGFYDGRLVLICHDSGERVCSCKFVGFPLAKLTERFGRVRAKAPLGGEHVGQLLI